MQRKKWRPEDDGTLCQIVVLLNCVVLHSMYIAETFRTLQKCCARVCRKSIACPVHWRMNHTVQMFLVYPCKKVHILFNLAGLLQIWSYWFVVLFNLVRTQSRIIPWYWNGQPFSNFQLIMICVHNITCFRLNFWTKSLIDPFWSHTPYGSGFSWQSRIDNMVSSSRLLDTNEWMDSHF